MKLQDSIHQRGEANDPVFSDYEDPDYHAFFDRVLPMIEGVETGTVSAGDAASQIFGMTNDYEFPLQLRSEALTRSGWLKTGERVSQCDLDFARNGFRWALTNPNTRDLCATIRKSFSMARALSRSPPGLRSEAQ